MDGVYNVSIGGQVELLAGQFLCVIQKPLHFLFGAAIAKLKVI